MNLYYWTKKEGLFFGTVFIRDALIPIPILGLELVGPVLIYSKEIFNLYPYHHHSPIQEQNIAFGLSVKN